MVDINDLGSLAARRVGSSPTGGTNKLNMRKLITGLLMIPVLAQAQHVSTVYYNVVNDKSDWYSNPREEDFTLSIVHYEAYTRITTNGREDSFYVLTDTLSSSIGFTKWSALDWKGDACQVSVGEGFDGFSKYMIVQYPDMGWCCIFDR